MSIFPVTSELIVRVVFYILVTFSRKCFTLSAAPIRSKLFKSHKCGTESYAFLQSIHTILKFLCFLLACLMIILSTNRWSFVPLDFRLHPFCSHRIYILFVPMSPFPAKWLQSSLAIIDVKGFHVVDRHVIGLQLGSTLGSIF